MEATTTISDLAGEAYDQFEQAERPSGDKFTRLKDGHPAWISDLIHEAHGEFLPDDWRYEAIQSALGWIHDEGGDLSGSLDDLAHEFADQNVDTYSGKRLEWLSSHLSRAGYVDQAREDGLIAPDTDTMEQIGMGQYVELGEVFASVRQSLEEHHDES